MFSLAQEVNMRLWLRIEWRRRQDDDDEHAPHALPLSERYVLAEQRTTDLMIALVDMQRERDAWRAEALAGREQLSDFPIFSAQHCAAVSETRLCLRAQS
jgi:hypothetical protein